MQKIILQRFMEADKSFSNKYQIMPVEHEVIISFEELGFVMQAVCEHPLANIYYSQLFDEKIQLLQSYTGLLYRDDNYQNHLKNPHIILVSTRPSSAILLKATPHQARLTACQHIYMHIFRHLARKI